MRSSYTVSEIIKAFSNMSMILHKPHRRVTLLFALVLCLTPQMLGAQVAGPRIGGVISNSDKKQPSLGDCHYLNMHQCRFLSANQRRDLTNRIRDKFSDALLVYFDQVTQEQINIVARSLREASKGNGDDVFLEVAIDCMLGIGVGKIMNKVKTFVDSIPVDSSERAYKLGIDFLEKQESIEKFTKETFSKAQKLALKKLKENDGITIKNDVYNDTRLFLQNLKMVYMEGINALRDSLPTDDGEYKQNIPAQFSDLDLVILRALFDRVNFMDEITKTSKQYFEQVAPIGHFRSDALRLPFPVPGATNSEWVGVKYINLDGRKKLALIEVRESVYIFKSVCYEFKKFVDDEMIEPALKKAARVGFEIGVLEAEATAHWDDNYKIKFENFPAQYKFHWPNRPKQPPKHYY